MGTLKQRSATRSTRAWLVAALSLAHARCGTPAPPAAADAPCPTAMPSAAAPCSNEGLRCGYLRCDAYGVGRAVCTGGAWSVRTEACAPTPCDGAGPCPLGSVCLTHVGGAVVSTCVSRPCAGDLVSCQCVCGGECVAGLPRSSPERPLGVACNSCSSGVCP